MRFFLRTNKGIDELEFQLNDVVSVSLSLQEPPFYSPFILHKQGSDPYQISINPTLTEQIKRYFQSSQSQQLESNTFILQLGAWGLNHFAEQVQAALSLDDTCLDVKNK